MKYYTIDLEWKIETAEIICGSIYGEDGKIAETFDTALALLQYIFTLEQEKKNRPIIIYSHYGGGSDFLFLLREIVGRKDCYLNEKEFFQASSKIISFSVYHGNKKYQFRDSYAILPSALEKLSNSFIGEGKIEDNKQLDALSRERIKEYCLNDARLLYRCIEAFMNMLDLEELQLTAASQALLDMRQRCDFSRLVEQDADSYLQFLPWFSGGHVDVYKRYAEQIYHYDIKSCYPASMWAFGCPIGQCIEKRKLEDRQCGLFTIKTQTNFFNPFWAHRTQDRTYWVNSNDLICCTDVELRKLEELKIDFKIIKGYVWECNNEFFRPFVDYWFNYRKLGDAQKEIGKIFLNAGGFGKFAIKRERESIVFGKDADYYLTGDYDIGVKRIWKDFSYSHIEIASRITAGARILLFEKQNYAVDFNSLVYSDTDSVFTDKEMRLEDGRILGNLEYQGMYDKGYFLGNKFYGLSKKGENFKAVLKGFPEKFGELQYMQALHGELTFKTVSNRLLKFRSAIRCANDFVAVREFLREIKKIEIKRKLLNDGINTLPYTLKGGELI